MTRHLLAVVLTLTTVPILLGADPPADHLKTFKEKSVDALSYAVQAFGEPTRTESEPSVVRGGSFKRLVYKDVNVTILLKDAAPPPARKGRPHWALVGFYPIGSGKALDPSLALKRLDEYPAKVVEKRAALAEKKPAQQAEEERIRQLNEQSIRQEVAAKQAAAEEKKERRARAEETVAAVRKMFDRKEQGLSAAEKEARASEMARRAGAMTAAEVSAAQRAIELIQSKGMEKMVPLMLRQAERLDPDFVLKEMVLLGARRIELAGLRELLPDEFGRDQINLDAAVRAGEMGRHEFQHAVRELEAIQAAGNARGYQADYAGKLCPEYIGKLRLRLGR